MAKNSNHLKLDTRAIIILIVFIIFMLVGTYLFAGYMLTGSRAESCGSGNGSGSPCADRGGGVDPANQEANHGDQNRRGQDGINITISPSPRVGQGSPTPTRNPSLTPAKRRGIINKSNHFFGLF